MAKAKAAGRAEEERPSTSSRIYVDSLQKLKLLADLDNINLADALDKVISAEFARRRGDFLRLLDLAQGDEQGKKKG
jgi:hypothetical protein